MEQETKRIICYIIMGIVIIAIITYGVEWFEAEFFDCYISNRTGEGRICNLR